MENITIYISIQYLDWIQKLKDLGRYPNRSEAIREALHQLFNKGELPNEDLEIENFSEMKTTTVNLPEADIKRITDKSISRSKLIRIALSDFFISEADYINNVKNYEKKQILEHGVLIWKIVEVKS